MIVALHGFNDYRAAFDDFGAFAAARGVLVEAYDQPGFGARPRPGPVAGHDELVAALDEAVGRPRPASGRAGLRARREHGRRGGAGGDGRPGRRRRSRG